MLTRRRALASLLGATAAHAVAQTAARRKPNFVVILADDLGYGDLGCYGSPDVPTPHIDSIASGGVRFTSGYVSAPMCSPSRAALMTGRYQQRFGHEHNCGPAARDLAQRLGLPLSEITLPQLLKGAGYSTGMVGKWHLGMNPEFHPISRGFDEYFGFLAGANSYMVKGTIGGIEEDTDEAESKMGLLDSRRQPIFRARDAVQETEYLTDAFGREAVSFIQRQARNPFFLYLPFNAVHTPLQVTQRYLDRFAAIKDPRHRFLAAMTCAMDDNVGKVLAALRATGVEQDTAVIFLSDNGCPTYTRAGSNGPLNGAKLTLYEGGVRVPFMARWPGKIKPRQVVDTPVVSRDIFTTLLKAAAVDLPKDREIDGHDLLPLLSGATQRLDRDALFWRNGPNQAVRRGDWKLLQIGDQTRLYNLKSDVGEKRDIATANPRVVADLKSALADWNKKLIPAKWPTRLTVDLPINGEKFGWTV